MNFPTSNIKNEDEERTYEETGQRYDYLLNLHRNINETKRKIVIKEMRKTLENYDQNWKDIVIDCLENRKPIPRIGKRVINCVAVVSALFCEKFSKFEIRSFINDIISSLYENTKSMLPYLSHSIIAVRMVEIMLYTMFAISYGNNFCNAKWRDLVLESFHISDASPEIQIASMMIICELKEAMNYVHEEMCLHLQNIIKEKTFFGFKEEDINSAILKIQKELDKKRCDSTMKSCEENRLYSAAGKVLQCKIRKLIFKKVTIELLKELHDLVIECRIILEKENYGLYMISHISELYDYIITIFDNSYSEVILNKYKINEPLNESEKLVINNVTLTVTIIGQYPDILAHMTTNIGTIIIDYIDYLSGITKPNSSVVRIIHICLYSLSDIIGHPKLSLPGYAARVFLNCYNGFKENKNIKLSSAFIIMRLFNQGSIKQELTQKVNTIEIFLRNVCLDNDKNSEYLGFTISSIRKVIEKEPLDSGKKICGKQKKPVKEPLDSGKKICGKRKKPVKEPLDSVKKICGKRKKPVKKFCKETEHKRVKRSKDFAK